MKSPTGPTAPYAPHPRLPARDPEDETHDDNPAEQALNHKTQWRVKRLGYRRARATVRRHPPNQSVRRWFRSPATGDRSAEAATAHREAVSVASRLIYIRMFESTITPAKAPHKDSGFRSAAVMALKAPHLTPVNEPANESP